MIFHFLPQKISTAKSDPSMSALTSMETQNLQNKWAFTWQQALIANCAFSVFLKQFSFIKISKKEFKRVLEIV